MALAIDASTPAIAVQSNGATATCTTASFTPPSGSTLLVLYAANTIDPTSPATPTITDSLGAHLTYTLTDHSIRSDTPAADGQAAAWTAPVSTSAAMTITVTNQAASGGRHAAVSVIVLTGAHATPAPVHGESGSISTGTVNQSYTANATGGQGFTAIADWNATGVMTAGTGTTRIGSANVGAPDYTYGFFRRTSADDVATSSNSVNATLGGTSTSVRWIWVEIVPSASGSTSANAENTAGTGASNDAAASLGVNAENTAATGAANAASADVQVNAGNAAGTGAANAATTDAQVNAEATSATGAANTAAASITVNAEATSGAGVANDATVSTSGTTNAPAENAAGTGAANDATVALAVNAGVTAATGAANDTSTAATVNVEATAGTGSAGSATIDLAVAAEATSGTGSAGDALAALAAAVEAALATAAALDPVFGNATAKAASTPTATAGRTSTATVTAVATSTATVSARATSTPDVEG